MKNDELKFGSDGKFVIMQVSDAQDLVYVRKAMVQMLDKAYDSVKPDLVLFTGDNILGNHLLDAVIGSRKVAEGYNAEYDRMEKSLRHILRPVSERKIPFGMIFGNHDDMNSVTKDEQIEIFRRYDCCLDMNKTDKRVDCDTYSIPIKSSDGSKTLFNIFMLDSAWKNKIEEKHYCKIKSETTAWFKETNENLRKENGGEYVPSLMFMHIPLPQELGLLKECEKGDSGAIEGDSGKYYRLDEKKAGGTLGEMPSVVTDDGGLFDAIKESGNVMAVAAGHDHRNSFDGTEDGVRFIQTACASFRCYGNNKRGVRLFILDENKKGEFETKELTYSDICGTSLRARVRYFLDADDLEKKKITLFATAAAVGAAAIAACALPCRDRIVCGPSCG